MQLPLPLQMPGPPLKKQNFPLRLGLRVLQKTALVWTLSSQRLRRWHAGTRGPQNERSSLYWQLMLQHVFGANGRVVPGSHLSGPLRIPSPQVIGVCVGEPEAEPDGVPVSELDPLALLEPLLLFDPLLLLEPLLLLLFEPEPELDVDGAEPNDAETVTEGSRPVDT